MWDEKLKCLNLCESCTHKQNECELYEERIEDNYAEKVMLIQDYITQGYYEKECNDFVIVCSNFKKR